MSLLAAAVGRRSGVCSRLIGAGLATPDRAGSTLPEDTLEPAIRATTLPRDAAGPSAVAMVVHSYYEEDPRVRRESEALVAAGHRVDVFALRRPGDEPEGVLDGVRIRRLDVQRNQGASLMVYVREYLSFLVRASWALVRAHRGRRYDLVQVHSLPDFLVAAAVPLRMAGVPVILDLHEAMPEFFRSRFPHAANPIVHRVLLAQERLSIAAADRTLTVNEPLRRRLIDRGVAEDRVHVVMNAPSFARFDPTLHPDRAFAADGVVRLVYAGALTPTYEVDVVLRAIADLALRRSDLRVELAIYGRGDTADALAELVAALRIDDRVTFHGRIPLEDVPAALASADVGLAPTRRDAFTDVSLSTKIFECAAMRRPVICSRLPLVTETFGSGTVWAYEPGDWVDLARAIESIADDPDRRTGQVAATLDLVRERSWERESERYLAIVDELTAPRRRSPR